MIVICQLDASIFDICHLDAIASVFVNCREIVLSTGLVPLTSTALAHVGRNNHQFETMEIRYRHFVIVLVVHELFFCSSAVARDCAYVFERV